MRVISFLITILAAGAVLAAPSGSVGIAAVVDDQVISTVDLNDRINLIIVMSGLPDTQETRARLAPQVLHQLVDEKLQMEEATRDGISVTDAKLKDGITRIEQQSGKQPGSLEQFLTEKHLPRLSFYAQVRAQVAWSEVILKKVRPRIRISDQEVARYIAMKNDSPVKTQEVQIATIQLPVDSPENEASTHKLADKLASEIRGGTSFNAVAAQFTSAAGGKPGEPFWVEMPQLDPVISAALAKISKGGITDPVRTASGYQIVELLDSRTAQSGSAPAAPTPARAELAFKQILMALKPDAKTKEAQLLLDFAKQVQRAPGQCDEKSISGLGDLSDFDFKVSMARAQSSDLPEKLRDLLMGMSVGSVSQPVVTPQGIRLFMLCEKIDLPAPPAAAPTAQDDTVRQAIYQQKLELEAQKYMRNLRREAFIEARLH